MEALSSIAASINSGSMLRMGMDSICPLLAASSHQPPSNMETPSIFSSQPPFLGLYLTTCPSPLPALNRQKKNCQAPCPFCVHVSKRSQKMDTDWHYNHFSPTHHPIHHQIFFWSHMKVMAKIRLFYSSADAIILPWPDEKISSTLFYGYI